LAGEAGDEVAVDVGDTGMAQAGEVVQDNGAGVESAADLRFAVDEGLDAEADAVDADGLEGGEGVVGDLTGGTFDGDFGVGMDRKLVAHGGEEALEVFGSEEAGSSAPEEDGVYGVGQFEAQFVGPVGCGGEVLDEAVDVTGVVAGWVNAGSEVAVGAFRPAEGDGDIEAECVDRRFGGCSHCSYCFMGPPGGIREAHRTPCKN